MDIEYNLDGMAASMALMVLRQIRDWNTDANIKAFSGDVEDQYKQLFKKFQEVIQDSRLFDPAEPSSPQRNQWMMVLEKLEAKVRPIERHLATGGDKGVAH